MGPRFATCRHCKKTLFYLPDSEKWVHVNHGDPFKADNCRAVSFRLGGECDGSLDASWQAEPEPGTIRS